MSFASAALALLLCSSAIQGAWLALAVATAKPLGAPVREANLGSSPTLLRFRVAGVDFTVGPFLLTAYVKYGTDEEPLIAPHGLPLGVVVAHSLLPWLALLAPAAIVLGPGAALVGVWRGMTLLFRPEDFGPGFAAFAALLDGSFGAALCVAITRIVGLNLLPLGSNCGNMLASRLLPEGWRAKYMVFSTLAQLALIIRALWVFVRGLF